MLYPTVCFNQQLYLRFYFELRYTNGIHLGTPRLGSTFTIYVMQYITYTFQLQFRPLRGLLSSLLAIIKNPFQFIDRKDFIEKWIDRFGSFWDCKKNTNLVQPFNPERVRNLKFASFSSFIDYVSDLRERIP